MRNALIGFVALMIASALSAGGCGGSHVSSGFTADAGGDDAMTGDDAGAGDGGLSLQGDSGQACSQTTCSGDLHQVLCNGMVMQTCGADQGCAMGQCVAACDAAKANKSTVGCDYYTIDPDAYSADDGDCFAAYIANTWGSDVHVSVDFGGKPLAPTFMYIPSGSGESITYTPLLNGTLPSGQVAIVFLSNATSAPVQCPAGVTAAYAADAAQHGTGIGQAFHVTTDRPVVAYDIYPYGGGDSAITAATLLVPTSAWDTNYVAADAYTGLSGAFSPWIAVVAQQDNTQITISPTAALIAGGTVPGTPTGVPHTWTINRGQVLQFTQTDGSEVNGSPIQSSAPVAVFGGITCMDVPVGAAACDAGHQQLVPVKALGHEYVYARYRDRYQGTVESPPVRIIGAVDGTTLTYDPAPPAGAPTTINGRQMVEFTSSTPFSVKSQDDQHPFYMAAYMTGCTAYDPGGGSDCRGDPEFVNVVPPQQYLPSYTFFTDPTYPETELVVVREKNAQGSFDDVTLDCLTGPVTNWQPVGAGGNYQYARVDLVTGNFQKVGACDNGRHQMQSKSPFGITVWGWGSAATGGQYRQPGGSGFYSQAVSYAYPAGASVQPITTVVVPPAPK